jgi:hypothetical protein
MGRVTASHLKFSKVTFETYPFPPPLVDVAELLPPKALIRAPFSALTIVMFLTRTLATISWMPAYWPREPTEMPCEPWQ